MLDETRVQALSQKILETPGFFEFITSMLSDEAVIIALQPRIEFLATVQIGNSIDDAIADCFGEMKLHDFSWDYDAEAKEHRVRADTYLVRVKLLANAGSLPPKAHVLGVIIEAEDFFELQTIKDMVLEKSFPAFQDFILVWDGNGVRHSWLSYITLHILENQLRKLVLSRVMTIEDQTWWDKRIKPLAGGYKVRKEREDNDSDITHYSDESLFDIFYTDLSTIEKIVSNPDNWGDAFEQIFSTKKYISRLNFLNRLRRKIAHNRFLSERNHHDLRDLCSNFLKVCRRIWGV